MYGATVYCSTKIFPHALSFFSLGGDPRGERNILLINNFLFFMVRVYLDYVSRDMGVCGHDDVKINADLIALMRKEKWINSVYCSTLKA